MMPVQPEGGRFSQVVPESPPTPTTPGVTPPATAGRDDNVLFARKSPVLSVQTIGPRQICVGKQSTYELVIENAGDVGADEVVVSIELPAWAEVAGADTRAGAAIPASNQAGGPLQWRVGHLAAKGTERLALKIIPRQSKPFDLGVRWNYKPVASQTMIEVQEPKLQLSLDGPNDVLFGKKEVYRLQVANTGTGPAENLMVELLPLSTDTAQSVTHRLGDLPAGQQKVIEVELTARQAGDLEIRVDVRGDGALHANLSEQVFVRRAQLQVEMSGPTIQYVGATAAYNVRVRNPGTAAAENVQVTLSLPQGAKYVGGIDGSQLVANGTKLQWTIPRLNASGEQSFAMQCSLSLPGASPLQIVATADGQLTDTAGMSTRVEAIADLALTVSDPSGPIPLGQEATYELRIANRGTKNAHNIVVQAFFSEGIEPTRGEGGQHQIRPGEVVFHPIPTVAAGEEVVLKVHAKASKPGNHVFRAEVHCQPLGTQLVSQESTHFYKTEATGTTGTSTPSASTPGATPPAPSTRPAPATTPPIERGALLPPPAIERGALVPPPALPTSPQ